MRDMKNKAAFFDFDLTITNYDSFRLFLWFYYYEYRVKANHFFLPPLILFLKKIGVKNLYETKEMMLFGLKNLSKFDILEIGKKYLIKYESKLFNTLSIRRIKEHQKNCEYVFIISSSPDIYFNHVKKILGVTNYYANKLEYDNNIFTGKLNGLDLFGQNKSLLIKKIAAEYNISLENSYSYSDSHTDLPMLTSVGKPTAVNPDKILRKHAQKSNWNIEIWR